MKKVIVCLMVLFLIVPIPIMANDDVSGIVPYGEENDINGTTGAKEVKLSEELTGIMLSNQSSLFFEGNDSFKIETGQPVKEFVVVNDIDKDGINDIAAVLAVNDGYDHLVIISAKESKVLFSTKYTFDSVDYQGVKTVKNVVIRQMEYQDGVLYCLYNHTVVAIDSTTFKTIFTYSADDNIWKIAVVDNQLLFTTQLGQFGSLDSKSGKEQYCQQITNPISVIHPYRPDEKNEVVLNVWDILVVKDIVYISSEDGNIHEVSKETGEIKNTLSLEAITQETLAKQLAMYENYDSAIKKNIIMKTGVYSKLFMSYKMKMIDQEYMLVECFMNDKGYTVVAGVNYDEPKVPTSVVIVDTKEFSVKTRIAIEQYSLLASEGIVTTYQDKQVYIVPTVIKDGKAKLFIYSLEDGSLLQQNTIGVGNYNQDLPMAFLKKNNTRYFLEVHGGSVIEIQNDFKTVQYFDDSLSVKTITNSNDKTLTKVTSKGKVVKIQMLGLQGKNDILASIDAPSQYPNNGFEAIQYIEDKNQVLSLVNEVHNGTVIASHIVIINLQDSSVLDQKVLINKGRDEKGKYYENYVQGESISYLTDLNGDKKQEILVDGYVIDGANYTLKSMYEQTVEEAGTIVPVGDVNADGIEDIVCLMENQMRLYTSEKTGYDISYKKTNILVKYDKSLLNQAHVKSIGDIEGNGSKLFVVNARNEQGCQYYQVINPKDLSVRFSLMKDGVFNWGESFSLTNTDYNQDGIHDIVLSLSGMCTVISGKDGSAIFEYSMDRYGHYTRESSPTALEEIVPISIVDNDQSLLLLEDSNEDGIKELGQLAYGNQGEQFIIIDGKTYQDIKTIRLNEYTRTNINSIISVVDQPRVIINGDSISQIFDYQKDALVVGCKKTIAYARGLSNGDIQLESSDQEIYSINEKTDFEIVDLDTKKISNGNLKVQFESTKTGVMSIYDNGVLIATTTKNKVDIKLIKGKHRVLFSYDDGHGKVTHQEKEIVVAKSNIVRYIVMLLSLGIVLLAIATIFYPRYRLLKKAGVKHG